MSGGLDSPQSSKDVLRVRVVAWFLADLSEQDSALWINHKGTAKLPGITLGAGLSKSLSKSSDSVSRGPQIDGIQDPALEPGGPVCCHGGVYE